LQVLSSDLVVSDLTGTDNTATAALKSDVAAVAGVDATAVELGDIAVDPTGADAGPPARSILVVPLRFTVALSSDANARRARVNTLRNLLWRISPASLAPTFIAVLQAGGKDVDASRMAVQRGGSATITWTCRTSEQAAGIAAAAPANAPWAMYGGISAGVAAVALLAGVAFLYSMMRRKKAARARARKNKAEAAAVMEAAVHSAPSEEDEDGDGDGEDDEEQVEEDDYVEDLAELNAERADDATMAHLQAAQAGLMADDAPTARTGRKRTARPAAMVIDGDSGLPLPAHASVDPVAALFAGAHPLPGAAAWPEPPQQAVALEVVPPPGRKTRVSVAPISAPQPPQPSSSVTPLAGDAADMPLTSPAGKTTPAKADGEVSGAEPAGKPTSPPSAFVKPLQPTSSARAFFRPSRNPVRDIGADDLPIPVVKTHLVAVQPRTTSEAAAVDPPPSRANSPDTAPTPVPSLIPAAPPPALAHAEAALATTSKRSPRDRGDTHYYTDTAASRRRQEEAAAKLRGGGGSGRGRGLAASEDGEGISPRSAGGGGGGGGSARDLTRFGSRRGGVTAADVETSPVPSPEGTRAARRTGPPATIVPDPAVSGGRRGAGAAAMGGHGSASSTPDTTNAGGGGSDSAPSTNTLSEGGSSNPTGGADRRDSMTTAASGDDLGPLGGRGGRGRGGRSPRRDGAGGSTLSLRDGDSGTVASSRITDGRVVQRARTFNRLQLGGRTGPGTVTTGLSVDERGPLAAGGSGGGGAGASRRGGTSPDPGTRVLKKLGLLPGLAALSTKHVLTGIGAGGAPKERVLYRMPARGRTAGWGDLDADTVVSTTSTVRPMDDEELDAFWDDLIKRSGPVFQLPDGPWVGLKGRYVVVRQSDEGGKVVELLDEFEEGVGDDDAVASQPAAAVEAAMAGALEGALTSPDTHHEDGLDDDAYGFGDLVVAAAAPPPAATVPRAPPPIFAVPDTARSLGSDGSTGIPAPSPGGSPPIEARGRRASSMALTASVSTLSLSGSPSKTMLAPPPPIPAPLPPTIGRGVSGNTFGESAAAAAPVARPTQAPAASAPTPEDLRMDSLAALGVQFVADEE